MKRKISPQGSTATSGWYGRKKGMATDLKRYDFEQMNMTSRVDGMTKLQTQAMTNTQFEEETIGRTSARHSIFNNSTFPFTK